ncbi:hypothetical protein BD309DRAFT_872545 [Dichomitus squalens]|uniref:Uncharacterized protein n=1 Tax=Dichomitus squalens TaxID=114155 RepID=A0A4Q9PEB2_9APHY|nr:hypothetical protein BD309DRAFT_872545 [Dichomitus squalens]TBU53240.1 hypothetical protein BD310DRAFT_830438 [Dichomitus squalens]
MPSAVPRGQPQTYPNRRVYPNLEEHLSIKTSCFAHYHDVHHDDLPAKLKECSEYLAKWPADKVLNMWRAGEPEAVLETAVRYMSGCTTFKVNPEGALFMLDAFYDPEYNKRDYVGDVASQSAMARAHSCAAHAHYQKFKASDEERLSYTADERHYRRRQTLEVGYGQPAHTSLGFALHHASESARLGHVSAIVLRVGFTAREIGESLGVDLTEMTKRAKKHRPLWRAVEDRLDELYAEARQALQSAERDPSEYICSAEGCSTWSASRASLRLCSGKCPQDLKPRYCSKQCQVKVRPHLVVSVAL